MRRSDDRRHLGPGDAVQAGGVLAGTHAELATFDHGREHPDVPGPVQQPQQSDHHIAGFVGSVADHHPRRRRAAQGGRSPGAACSSISAIVGGCDEDVAYATRLWATGGQAELHLWAGFHGISALFRHIRVSAAARRTQADWLARVLNASPEHQD